MIHFRIWRWSGHEYACHFFFYPPEFLFEINRHVTLNCSKFCFWFSFKLLPDMISNIDIAVFISCLGIPFFINAEIRTWHCVEGDWLSQSSKPKFNSRRFIRIDIRTKLASVQNSYCDVTKPSTLRLIPYVKQKKVSLRNAIFIRAEI